MFLSVWMMAAGVFGKKAGHPEPLSPYGSTWKQIIARCEDALWLWNEQHGPLNAEQREYATELLCAAIKHAGSAPSPAETYPYFHAQLNRMLTHERVRAGFRSRETEVEEPDFAPFDVVWGEVPA